MRIGVYSIQDQVAGAFMHPFLSQANGVAIRQFGDSVRDESTPMGKHPGDYRLARIGSFDDETALFESVVPEFISRGLDHVESNGAAPLAVAR